MYGSGGCILYVIDGFNFKYCFEFEDYDFEVIWIEGKINKIKYVIGCVYRVLDVFVDDFFSYFNDVV